MSGKYMFYVPKWTQLPRLDFWKSNTPSHAETIIYENDVDLFSSIGPAAKKLIEDLTDRRSQIVKTFLKANHVRNIILGNGFSRTLLCDYWMGANADTLRKSYDNHSSSFKEWQQSPNEITSLDWEDYLGQPEFHRAYLDFFEDQNVEYGYLWRDMIRDFLFTGDHPLINALICGSAQPLRHLGFAFESGSPLMAIEALALCATCYSGMSKYLSDLSWSTTEHCSSSLTYSSIEILEKIRQDNNMKFEANSALESDELSILRVLEDNEQQVIGWWNAWDLRISSDGEFPVPSLEMRFEESQRAVACILVAGIITSGDRCINEHLYHAWIGSHAVRVLINQFPKQFQIRLIRAWWLFTLLAYIAAGRPIVDLETIQKSDLKERTWKFVRWRIIGHELVQSTPDDEADDAARQRNLIMNTIKTGVIPAHWAPPIPTATNSTASPTTIPSTAQASQTQSGNVRKSDHHLEEAQSNKKVSDGGADEGANPLVLKNESPFNPQFCLSQICHALHTAAQTWSTTESLDNFFLKVALILGD